MADATITAAQVGAYERPLTANTVYTIDVVPANTVAYAVVAIFNHGTAPVFVKAGGTVTVDDATADIIPPGTYIERQVEHKGATATIAAISGSAGSVSVARSPRPHPLGAAASGGAGGGTVTLAGGTATVGQVGAASTVVSGTSAPSTRPSTAPPTSASTGRCGCRSPARSPARSRSRSPTTAQLDHEDAEHARRRCREHRPDHRPLVR
jgi:hypothetical protein